MSNMFLLIYEYLQGRPDNYKRKVYISFKQII
jgi:hypothetical protein